MNLLITPAMGYIVPLLFFYKESFDTNNHDMPLNKRNQETNQTNKPLPP